MLFADTDDRLIVGDSLAHTLCRWIEKFDYPHPLARVPLDED
jgi:hypothetical protein